jgi:hypothetical protein
MSSQQNREAPPRRDVTTAKCNPLQELDPNAGPNTGHPAPKRQLIALVDQENTYLPRGQHSQDTPELSARRREIHGIQRRHHAQVHHGEPDSQTPPLYSLTTSVPTSLSYPLTHTQVLLSITPPTASQQFLSSSRGPRGVAPASSFLLL